LKIQESRTYLRGGNIPPKDGLYLSRSEKFTVSRGSRPKAVEGEI